MELLPVCEANSSPVPVVPLVEPKTHSRNARPGQEDAVLSLKSAQMSHLGYQQQRPVQLLLSSPPSTAPHVLTLLILVTVMVLKALSIEKALYSS